MKEGPRELKLREQREEKFRANHSGGGVESRHADNLKADTGGARIVRQAPVERNAATVEVAPDPPETQSKRGRPRKPDAELSRASLYRRRKEQGK